MNISTNFKKKPWIRRVHPDKASGRFVANYRPLPGSTLSSAFVQLTSEDLLNELAPAAHPINSHYMSTRPIWGPAKEKNEDGSVKWEIKDYDELESVALGWQQFIVTNKIAHLTGNGGFETANETLDDEKYGNLLSWMDYVGLKDAYSEAVYYAERSGDAGILLYQTNDNELDWEVYSTEKGHTIYPQEDQDGNPIYYIQYWKEGREMCDIISTRSRETWVHADEADEQDIPFFEKIWRIVKVSNNERSEDGWTLVSRKDSQAGSDINQFVYLWVPDASWGPAELSIEAHENAASYVANEVKDSAFPLLILKAEKTVSLPPSGINGKSIGIKGTSEQLAHSDVKYESPADASNIATTHFKELTDNIVRTTMTAIITPDLMKQGADSSTSIKILFRPEIEWAKQRWIYYVKPVRHLLKVFKRLVGKAEGEIGKYDDLRVSVWFEPWVPQNEQEQTKIILDKVYARVLSRKAAQNELGSPYRGDYDTIREEWEEELRMKSEIPAAAKAKYGTEGEVLNDDDKNPADVNNQALGQSIQE